MLSKKEQMSSRYVKATWSLIPLLFVCSTVMASNYLEANGMNVGYAKTHEVSLIEDQPYPLQYSEPVEYTD